MLLASPGFAPAPSRLRLAMVLLGPVLPSLLASESASSQHRLGISLGGASMVALVAEYRWNESGVEAQVGSWGAGDLSLAVTGKRYFGARAARPFAGAGFWIALAGVDGDLGAGLVARAAAGVEWSVAESHAPALTIYLNRALAVRRPASRRARPLRRGLVPLPEISYRWRFESRAGPGDG